MIQELSQLAQSLTQCVSAYSQAQTRAAVSNLSLRCFPAALNIGGAR
jgi:hypothetical protein